MGDQRPAGRCGFERSIADRGAATVKATAAAGPPAAPGSAALDGRGTLTGRRRTTCDDAGSGERRTRQRWTAPTALDERAEHDAMRTAVPDDRAARQNY
jgi:hypothetical protein